MFSIFPEFMVVAIKTVPASPTAAESATVVQYQLAYDHDLEPVKTMLYQKNRELHVPTNVFGPGAPRIDIHVYRLLTAPDKK
jgi:hypothetical protein